MFKFLPFFLLTLALSQYAQSDEKAAPIIHSVSLLDGTYTISFEQPEGSLIPTGSYDTIINGHDKNDRDRHSGFERTISDIDTTVEQCFMLEARYTEIEPLSFPRSNEVCIIPKHHVAAVITGVNLINGEYTIHFSQPEGSTVPAGGYGTIINGEDMLDHNNYDGFSRTISGLSTNIEQCFKIKSRFTQIEDPYTFPWSEEYCVDHYGNLNEAYKNTLSDRKAWIQSILPNQTYYYSALADLIATPNNLAVQDRIQDIHCLQEFHTVQIGTFALGSYWNNFSDTLKNEMKNCIKSWSEILGHGTENHALNKNVAGLLFAEWFPNESGWPTSKTSEEIHSELKTKIIDSLSSKFEKGYRENLSPTYDNLHIYPILALYEFSNDQQIREAAKAALLFHFSNIAMNSFIGQIIAPYSRSNFEQFNTLVANIPQGNNPFIQWLYWPERTQFSQDAATWQSHAHNHQIIFHTLSSWSPPFLLNQIANSRENLWINSTSSSFNLWGAGTKDENIRTVHKEVDFAVGSGFFRYNPAGFYLDYKNFGILYESEDKFNTIETTHNYWRSDQDEALAWSKNTNSIFNEHAQFGKVVISLFNIPTTDPWKDVGRFTKAENNGQTITYREAHYNNLIQRADTRYPKSIDETVESNGWIFLRENDVYIGIKPLKGYTIDHSSLQEHNVIRSTGSKNAIIHEVGTKRSHGSFTNFQTKLIANFSDVNWDTLSVSYIDSQGRLLEATWDAPAYSVANSIGPDAKEREITERVLVKPKMLLQGTPIPNYSDQQLPVLDSKNITLKNRKLHIEYQGRFISVDWPQGEEPIFSSN